MPARILPERWKRLIRRNHSSGLRMYLHEVISTRCSRIPVFLIGSGIVMTMISLNSLAAEWSITPTVRFGGEYSDNIFLSSANPINTTSTNLTPEVRFNRANPNSAASIGARAQFRQYSDEELRDTNVQFLTLRSHYRSQQRSIWRLNGVLRRDTTITTAQVIDDLTDTTVVDENTGDPIDTVDTDVNLVDVEVRRNRIDLEPSWQYSLTELTSLRLRYRLQDVHYDNLQGTNLIDYRTHTVDTSLFRNLTQQDSLGMTLRLSRYSAPGNDTETDNLALNFGYDHRFQQDLLGGVTLGYRETTTKEGANEDTFHGAVVSVEFDKKQTALTSYNVSLTRDLNASGIGRIQQSDQLSIRVRSKLSPRLSSTFRVQAFDNNTLSGSITGNDRQYYSIEPGLRWAMTREWSVEGGYRYRWQKRELDTDSADSNTILVTLNYTWPRFAVSR